MISIAIDGPAGSGKSTVAKKVAEALGIVYLDTGAMYRAITLKVMRLSVELNDLQTLQSVLEDTHIDITENSVWLDQENVTEQIRSQEVTRKVSEVASIEMVREKLVSTQRKIAKGKSIVMDGRDIGSVVLPDAELKFFLTATAEVRGKRRWLELKEKGKQADLNDVVLDIQRRDMFDENREHSPLVCTKDAVRIDTSAMTVEEVSEVIIRLAQAKQV